MQNGDDGGRYTVLVNHEEQYSIWPVGRDCPEGWREIGFRGAKDDCLNHIKTIWTDMRPVSLRHAMTKWARSSKRPDRATQQSIVRPRRREMPKRERQSES